MESKNNHPRSNDNEDIISHHSGSDEITICSNCNYSLDSLNRSESNGSSNADHDKNNSATFNGSPTTDQQTTISNDINIKRSACAVPSKRISHIAECPYHESHTTLFGHGLFNSDQRNTITGSCSDINIRGTNSSCPCSHSTTDSINKSTNKKRAPSITSLSRSVSATSAIRPFSMPFDTSFKKDNPRDLKNGVKENSDFYLTPWQRKDREMKELKKEINRLHQDAKHKNEKIFSLEQQLDEQSRDFREEMERYNCNVMRLMEEKKEVEEAGRREKMLVEEELTKMDTAFTELKVKQQLQEDQFQDRYLDMYRRGQKAARFEREQELEMIASSKQPKVTVRELTRKLSITETELAKWQSIRLDETYKSAEKPATDADVTLSFLKDSFYHFVCDSQDRLRHFRAMVEIFKYSDEQMTLIRKAVSESKDFSRLFKKDVS